MRLARNLTAAIIAIGVSAGALTISGKSAAQSEAEPQLVVVWGGFWIGPRHHIADLIVYADGQVIYVDQFSDSVWPSIEPWATARIDSDTLQDLVGEVQLGLQRSKGCNVHGPGAADMPVPTIYLKD